MKSNIMRTLAAMAAFATAAACGSTSAGGRDRGRPRAAQRQGRHGRLRRSPRRRRSRSAATGSLAVGTNEEIARRTSAADDRGHRPRRPARDSRLHRGARPLHGPRPAPRRSSTSPTRESWDDIVAMVGAAARDAQPGAWISGRGWHQEKWDRVAGSRASKVCRCMHALVGRVSPNNPVLLTTRAATRRSPTPGAGARRHHARHAESRRAARSCGTRRASRPVCCARRRSGLVGRGAGAGAKPAASPAEVDARAAPAGRARRPRKRSARASPASTTPAPLRHHRLLQAARGRGRAAGPAVRDGARASRTSAMDAKLPQYRIDRPRRRLPDGALDQAADRRRARRARRLAARAVRRPAAQHRPHPRAARRRSRRTAELAIKHGYQVNTHAIGDRANREVLDIYERASRRTRQDGPALAHRARAAPRPRRHPALRRARRHRLDAGRSTPPPTARGCSKRLGPERADERRLPLALAARRGRRRRPTAPTCRSRTIDPIASFYATVTRRMRDG